MVRYLNPCFMARLMNSGVTSWNLIKMDAEGFEPFIFEGGPETLARTEWLALEYAPVYWKKAKCEPAEVFKTLTNYFSRIYRFNGRELVGITTDECVQRDTTVDLLLRR